MLLANISVAKKIFQHFPEFAVLRRHPSPPPANYDILVKAARSKVCRSFVTTIVPYILILWDVFSGSKGNIT